MNLLIPLNIVNSFNFYLLCIQFVPLFAIGFEIHFLQTWIYVRVVLGFHFLVVVVFGKEKLLNLDICLYILLDIKMSYFTLSFSLTLYAIDCCL